MDSEAWTWQGESNVDAIGHPRYTHHVRAYLDKKVVGIATIRHGGGVLSMRKQTHETRRVVVMHT